MEGYSFEQILDVIFKGWVQVTGHKEVRRRG